MKYLKLSSFLTLLSITIACSSSNPVAEDEPEPIFGTFEKTLVLDGLEREYILYVPESYNPSAPTPLLFNFHGFTSSAERQMTLTADMRPLADEAGFLLVYPQGALFFGNTHWNVGSWTEGSTTNDLGFTDAMIQQISADYTVDADRIYASGFSNGGAFSYELACNRTDVFAAIGVVGGTMTDRTYNSCNAESPMPTVIVHGSNDPVIRPDGTFPTQIRSQQEVINFWTGLNNTTAAPTVTSLPDIDPNDGSTVELRAYNGGNQNAQVHYYLVEGGEHNWPGSSGNMDIDAGEVIWEFVSRFDRSGLRSKSINTILSSDL